MSNDVAQPLRLADTLFINAAFVLPSGNARKLLPKDVKINLVEGLPGQALLIVAFAHYRQCPFGAYSEATLALMSTHEWALPIVTLTQLLSDSRYPAYVLHMLVDNEEARRLGVELWSLPRQLADVRVVEQDGGATCEVTMDGHTVVQFVAERPNTDRPCEMQIETYSRDQNGLVRSMMRCHAEAYGSIRGSGGTLRWGNHPIAQRLATMGIKSDPLMVRYYDHMLAELSPPRRV